jgi:hypothetical protein
LNAGNALQPAPGDRDELRRLQRLFDEALADLRSAEQGLAGEQAAVNAFRMHCRLKIGFLADRAAELRTEKQRLLTRLQLLRQAEELGIPYQEDDPFWQGEPDAYLDDLPFPTDTPRDKVGEKRIYRQLAQRFHPDLATGSGERAYRTALMASINSAYAAGDIAALRDFAEELDPALFVEMGLSDSREIRQLRDQIARCRRRTRRLAQERRALHNENTARLYRRAAELEAEGRSWWDEVSTELEIEIAANEAAVAALREELARLQPLAD